MNFMQEIFGGKVSEASHRQFIRFGKGEYGGRALLGLWITASGVKVKSSFEFANDFVFFVANLVDVSFNGTIWSKDELQGLSGKKKEGKWIYEVKNLSSSQIKNLLEKAYYFLLNYEKRNRSNEKEVEGDSPRISLPHEDQEWSRSTRSS